MAPLICFWALLVAAADKSNDLAIVVNESSLLEDISSTELTKIFKAERTRSPGGFKFVIAVREKGSPENNAALQTVYHMTDAEFDKFFLQATFAGRIQEPPKQLSSSAAVRQFITLSPGAIGYLRASEVDDSVKVLKIDGKLPGDPGYPIRIN